MFDEKKDKLVSILLSITVHGILLLCVFYLASKYHPNQYFENRNEKKNIVITYRYQEELNINKKEMGRISEKKGYGKSGKSGKPKGKIGSGGNHNNTKSIRKKSFGKKTVISKVRKVDSEERMLVAQTGGNEGDPDIDFLKRISSKIAEKKASQRESMEIIKSKPLPDIDKIAVPSRSGQSVRTNNDYFGTSNVNTPGKIRGNSEDASAGNTGGKTFGAEHNTDGGDGVGYGVGNGRGDGEGGGGRGGTGGGNGTGTGTEGNGTGNGGGMVCPDEMVFVPGRSSNSPFCIDKYEYPNKAGAMPRKGITFQTAQRLCKASGKRLCSDDEWQEACGGMKQTTFPYGYVYVPDKCNENRDGGVSSSGSYKKCVSDYHVYDLVGNLWDLVVSRSGKKETPVLRGGSYRNGGNASCSSRKSEVGDGNDDVGFRCCL